VEKSNDRHKMGDPQGQALQRDIPTATRNSTLTTNSQDKTITGIAIDPQSGTVTPCNELIIPFKTMFRRPSMGPQRDVHFTQETLLKFADSVWEGIAYDMEHS